MSSKEGQREKERGSTVKGSSGTKGDDSLGKRSKSTGGMKGDKSDKAEPGTTEPSPLERKSSSKKKRSFFKRSRSSSGTRSSSKAVVNGGGGDDDDDGGGGGGADSEFRGGGGGGGGAEGAGVAGLGDHRAVVSDDEGSAQVSRPRDRLRRMTVKEARMEKRVKWMSSANALPSRSQRRRRALAKGGDYDDYDGMDDDDGNFEDSGSVRALSVSTPDLHRDDDDFNQIENIVRSPMRSTTKEIRRPEKLHKIIKSTSPSRGKESKSGKSGSSKTEGGYSNQKGDPVRYIRVGRDIKHTEKKVPSSPLTSRHAKRSPSGSRSPTTKARGLSKDRHRQSRSKSPKRADSRTRTPQVVRSLSASNETLKTKKLKDRRTKSMEKTSRRARDQDQAQTGKSSPLSPRAAAKRSESRRAHREREYPDSDDSDINEPHTLFMELSKTVSPYSSSAAHQETQNELALNKYNLLKRSSSNLLQLVKDSEVEALPMADAGKMQSLSVAKDTHQRSVSPRGRPSHSGKEEARRHRSRHSESREKSSGGGGGSMEPRSSSRRANNSEEPLSPTIPDGSVFYDDDNVSPVSPTFPSSSSQKYTRTFSPTRHTLRDWKRTGSRADDDYDDDDDDVRIDIETSDFESDPTAGKPYSSEKSPLRSPRYEGPPGHSSSLSTRYGSRSPEKSVQSPTIKVSKPDFDNASPGHKAPSPTKSRDTSHPSSKSNTASFIPSPSVKSSHTASIPTVGVPTEISKDPLSRSGSAKSNTAASAVDPTRLTITIPQRFSTDDDESVSPMSLNSHSRSLSSKSPSKSPALSPVSASQKSSSVSTDGSSTAALSQPSTSRSPSPNTASNVFNEPHPHTGVSGGSTWFDKIHEMKIGSRRPATAGNEGHKMFFPEIDVKRPRAIEALQRESADTKGKKKNVKVQRSFSERDASKRPAPRIPEIMVKTDSMQKITRISAENIRRFGEADAGDNSEKMLMRGGRSSSGFMGMRRKGDKLTSSESALEKAGEKQALLEAKKEMEEGKKEKSKTKRWSLKGKSKDKAMEKKKELEKKKSKKEKKSSKKVKKSDSVNSKKDDQGGPHASTQTVLLGEHLAGIKLDVEANYDEDGGEDGSVRKTDKSAGGLSLSAVVLLKNRLARQRRLRIGFDLENDEMDSVTEFRELNLLNQLVRQPLDAPLSLENETNLFKPLDIRETALVDDDPTQTGGMYEKIDTTKQLKEDDPDYQARRAEMRRESKAFRMRERRRKILSCIKKFIAFLFSHIGLCSLVVAYSIMGGFVFKAIEGPFEEESRIVNITKIRTDTVAEINKLSQDLKQGRATTRFFMKELDIKLKKFQLTVHNATKNEVYTEGADERDLKWSYASSLLYAITVMTTIGYGHVAPKTPYGRIVTIFYAVLGIPLTLLCLTNIGNLMADGFRILYGKICCGLCCLLFKPRRYGRRRRRHFHDPEFCNCEVTERKVEKSNEVVQVPTSLCILLIAAYIFAGALLFSLWEKWDYLTGSYFCFITLSTIGFGDIVPGTDIKSWSQQEKLVLCALYLVIGLSLIAMCFNLVQEDVKAKCRWLGRKFGIIDKDDTSIN